MKVSESAPSEARLARHVACLDLRDVPAATRERLLGLLHDIVACMIAGLRSPECARLAARAVRRGGVPEASIVGSASRVPAGSAAFVNAAHAHWYEWDDVHDPGALHTGAVIFPVLLALAEATAKDNRSAAGPAFMSACVGAFDVAGRLGEMLTPWSATAWMPTGAACTVGAAAGAARLLGLDEAGIHSAMGFAATAGGLSRQPLIDKVDGKNVLCAQSASRAIEAALLAADALTGARHFLAGNYGLNQLYAGGRADPSPALDDLGRRYALDEVSLKPYPCCRSAHPAIGLALDLQAQDSSAPDAIASVEVSAPRPMYEMCGAPFQPGDNPRVSAQFSIAYTVAVALARGRVGLDDFDATRVAADPAILDLARLIRTDPVVLAPGTTSLGQPVTLRVKRNDGSTVERTSSLVRGSPALPMSSAERSAKLVDAARGVLTEGEIDEISSAVAAVGEHGVTPILRCLRAARRPTQGK